ncbi:MAG: hypothetical protein ACYTFO_04450 [Planctomycetota bacterium]
MRTIACLCALLAAVGCQSAMEIEVPREGDTVEIIHEPGQTVLDIHSEMGIGKATITPAGQRPERLVLRLHIRNLEGLTMMNSQVEVSSFLRSQPEVEYYRRNESGGFDRRSPAGKVTVEIQRVDDYIEAVVPPLMLEDPTDPLWIQWVDYYR